LVVLVALASVTSLGFGAALVLAGSKAGSPSTTTVSDSATTTPGAGDFTYDGQTIPYSSWASDMGDASGGKLVYVQTPFSFDCTPGSLTASAKKDLDGDNLLVYTFTVGAGSDPAVPAGSVIVGVGIHSGNAFSVISSEWVSDGSQVEITISKYYSNVKVFYCTPSSGTTTIGGTTYTSTIISTTTTTITQATTETETVPGTTVTLPAETITKPVTVTVSIPAVTVTTPGTTTVVTVPAGATTTVTLPTQTVTLPTSTVTLPGETVVHDPVTVTQPGTTQTITAGATTTVVTVTAPNKTVEGGVFAGRTTVVTVTGPMHTVQLPGHIIKEVVKAQALVRTIYKSLIRACQPATGAGKG
jgi:hypothetical protein